MNHQDIDQLLERYWAGDTTLDEERQLKEWFAQHTPDAAHEDAALLFGAIRREKQVETSSPAPIRVAYGAPVRRYLIAAALTGLIAAAWWLTRPKDPDMPAIAAAITMPQPPGTSLQAPTANETRPTSQRLTDKARKIIKKRLHKPQATSEAVCYTEAEAQQAALEIKAALALVSRKLHRAQDASKGLKKVELVDQFIKTPS